jgi:hypothetical protein
VYIPQRNCCFLCRFRWRFASASFHSLRSVSEVEILQARDRFSLAGAGTRRELP